MLFSENDKLVNKLLAKYIYVFSILFAFGVIIFFPKWIVDDAYIIFRYSENLANHFQLTWNLNANPVEGYTGVILPVLIAIAMKIGIMPVIVTHSIGIISFIIGGIFLYLLVKKIKIVNSICAVIVLLYSTTPIIYTHIFSGLETILFSSTIIIIMYFSILILHNSIKISHYILFSLLLLYFSLIRPEGILFSLLISLFCMLYFFVNKKAHFNKLIINLIIFFIIPFAIYFFWRWNYYGQFFPNTYYLKTGNFIYSSNSYNSFIEFIKNYFGFPFIIAFFSVFINIDKVWKEIKENKSEVLTKEFFHVFLPTILFTIILLLQYFHTNLIMGFSFRFFVPTYATILILLAVLLNFGYKNLRDLSISNPLTFLAYFILIALLFFIHVDLIINDFKKETSSAQKYKILLEEEHIPAGKFLEEHFNKDLTLLVYIDAGAIPFFSKLNTIDFGGLNDDFLSHRNRLSNEQITKYFFEVDADVLAITSGDRKTLIADKNLRYIIEDERFKKYILVKVFETSVRDYYQHLFVKKELVKK